MDSSARMAGQREEGGTGRDVAGRGLPLLSNQHAVAASGWAGLGC